MAHLGALILNRNPTIVCKVISKDISQISQEGLCNSVEVE